MQNAITCPHCKADVDYLNHYQTGTVDFIFYIQSGEYEQREFSPDSETSIFACPECSEEIDQSLIPNI